MFRNTPGPITCPVCNHNYIKWENYENGNEKTANTKRTNRS